ncbi:zinc finger SWIM domain-containing protein 7 homolog isoform X1 [Halyomorpha halys]|uniref:zinc finger SWIM domain-containing protein 7 homolog isoform X1 n=1 Tax=Halyomorpha halys TaxID=286706 RepID=UPI0006D4E33D
MEVIYNSCGGGLKTIILDAVCKKIIDNNNEIADEDITVLYQIFDQTLFKALDLIDKECIELLTISKTDRTYFSVQGANGFYTIYPHINFCECPMFKAGVKKNQVGVICKHVLACHLAFVLKKYKTRTTSELVYTHY